MSSQDIRLELKKSGGGGGTRRPEPDNESGRPGHELGREPGSDGVGALAVVDLTTECTPDRRRELVEAAHGASRMGVVVLLLLREDWEGVDALLMESVARNGLGRGGVRCEFMGSNEAFPVRYRFAPLRVTGAPVAPFPGEGGAVLSLELGLERLRELGRGPVFRGPDPIFRPITAR